MAVSSAKYHLSYAWLIFYSALLGLFGGVVTILFIFAFQVVQHFLWDYVPSQLGVSPEHSLLPIVICTIGGLLVGLAIKYLGDYPSSIEQAIDNYKTTKRFDYEHIWQAFVISVISLGFGAALGPEAALTSIIGGFVTLIGLKLQKAAALSYGAKLDKKISRIKYSLLGVVAALSGLMLFRQFSGSEGYFDLNLQPYTFQPSDILWALLLTSVGVIIGYTYVLIDGKLERNLAGFRKRNIIAAAALGGLGLGILASLQPLALFSGHEGLKQVSELFYSEGGWFLLIAAGVKIIAASICLATGWKGGRFFPIMFAGAAAGLGLAHFFPAISPTLGLGVTMSATLAYVLKKPVATIVLLIFFLPANLYVLMALAAFMAATTSKKLPSFSN